MARAKKVILLGFDGATVEFVERFMAQGKLPNYRKLMKMGSFMRNCLCPYPTITPPNWTTIATGAQIGTHGITCFWQHHTGDPLDKLVTGFNSRDNRAEYFWAAAGRAGKRSIVFNFPSSWPPVRFPGIQVDGSDLTVGSRTRLQGNVVYSSPAVAAPKRKIEGWLYQPEQFDQVSELKPASGWRNLKLGAGALEMELDFTPEPPRPYEGHPDFPVREWKQCPVKRYLLVDKSRGRRYDRVRLFSAKDGRKLLAEAGPNTWSDWVQDKIELLDGVEKVYYRMRGLQLDPAGKFARVLVTSLMVPKRFTRPAAIAQELFREVGPHLPGTAWVFREDETGIEIESQIHQWYGRAVSYLAHEYPWDVIFMHAHAIDFANHWWIDRAEPAAIDWPGHDRYQKLLRKAYQVTDDLLGDVMKLADDETIFVLVSDHGSTTRSEPGNPFGNPHQTGGKILEDAGLLVYHKQDANGPRRIDWKKTRAACQRAGYVYVNLRGRDPEGIIEPGDYERVRTEVVNLFYDYTDPATGKKPITLAIRKEHAMLFGLYGEGVGDVVYALEPEFEHAHGQELPTAKFGIGSQTSLLVMAGPGIKANHVVHRPTKLEDIVPTLSYLTGFPIPRQAEGGIIYQALEDL